MRRRQDRDDPAACKQANTQESAHRFSFSLGINFLRRYHSLRCTKEHSKWFAIAQFMALLCNVSDGPQSLVVVPEDTSNVPRKKKSEIEMQVVKCVANCELIETSQKSAVMGDGPKPN
jgi:hypothetical protein